MKEKIDIIFIVLVYRNYEDLKALCNSLVQNVKDSYKVIVVDAFYDEKTSEKIKRLSNELECVYLLEKNGGYGYGNNRGLELAEKMFDYKYACICNPDTVLKTKISVSQLSDQICVAPKIISAKGKNQNPYWAFENLISEKLIYWGYKFQNKWSIYLGVLINKLLKGLFYMANRIGCRDKIYACHGSFFFLNENIVKEQSPFFDENMFLFYEEAYLAKVLKNNEYSIKYDRNIVVKHKEDGSMNIAQLDEYPHLRKSYIIYYERCRQ